MLCFAFLILSLSAPYITHLPLTHTQPTRRKAHKSAQIYEENPNLPNF